MATNYPGALDNFGTVPQNQQTITKHRDRHQNIEDAVESLESVVGITGSPNFPGQLRAELAASSGSSLVGFLQAGTGAVPRTAQSKMRERVSVEDFGAVADYNPGTDTGTDNTAAFLAAYNHLVSLGGGVIDFDQGEYLGHIEIKHPFIRLRGQGSWATTIRNVDNRPVIKITNADRSISDDAIEGMTIRNRNKATWTSSDGLQVIGSVIANGCDFLSFDDLYIFQMRSNIHLEGRSIWNRWSMVRCAEAIVNNLNVDAYNNLAAQLFEQCRFGVAGQHGIFLSHSFSGFPTVNWSFRNCTIERNLKNGVRVTGSAAGIQAWTFDNCYFEENTDTIPAGGGGGLVKSHVFIDTPSVFGLAFRECSMFGETGGDPAMDYHIYVNTDLGGTYFGEVENCRFGISTIKDIFWKEGVVLGKNLYTSGNNSEAARGSLDVNTITDPAISFTPTIKFGGAAVGLTYGSQVGRYMRHGNLVHFNVYVTLTSKGSSTGALTIDGLPFVAVNSTNVFQPVTFHTDGLTATTYPITGFIRPNTSAIELYKNQGTAAAVTDADSGNFGSFMVSGTIVVR